MRNVPIGKVAKVNPTAPKDLAAIPNVPTTFIPMAAVSEEGQIVDSQVRPVGEVLKGYRYFEQGDVLVAKITPCMENGKAAITNNIPHKIGFGSTEFHVLRPTCGVDGRYLFHMVWNPMFRRVAERNMTGTAGQKRVPTDFVKRYQIPLPPLPEQRRIAAILDKADAIRRKRQEALVLTDEFLRSAFLEMFGDPVTNPKGWKVKSIGTLATDVQYGTSKKSNEDKIGLPVLRMGNLTYGGDIDLADLKWVELDEREQEKLVLTPGDLLFNRTNSRELVGKTAVWHSPELTTFAGYLIRVRFNPQMALSDYISWALNSSSGKRLLYGMAKPAVNMSNISATDLKRIELAIPPINDQKRFSEVVQFVSEKKKAGRNAMLEKDSLFKSLTQRAFRGEL